MTSYGVIFDGGSRGNPGPGYGSYRLRASGAAWGPPVRLSYGRSMTSNEAEYRTLIAALASLAEQCPDPAAARVEVQGDSQLVIRQLGGEWKVRAANLQPLWEAARTAAGAFAEVRYTWQPREASVALLGH